MRKSKRGVSKGSGNGSSKLRNSENGADWKVEVMRQFYFAMEAPVLGKHLSGNTSYSRGVDES